MSFPIAINLDWEEMMTQRSTQKFPLGSVGRMLDGRSFRYAKNGAAALATGCVVISPAPLGWSGANGTSGPFALENGTTQTSTWKTLQLETTFSTLVTKDYFKDGWLQICSTGRYTFDGQSLQIKTSKAHTASSTLLELTLMDGQSLLYTLNTSDVGFKVLRNPYDMVITPADAAITPVGDILGVPPRPITASYFFWLQTWGMAALEAAIASAIIGAPVGMTTVAASTGFAPNTSGSGGAAQIATLISAGANGAYMTADLKIAP